MLKRTPNKIASIIQKKGGGYEKVSFPKSFDGGDGNFSIVVLILPLCSGSKFGAG
jgi:hypothetical protein